MKETPMKPVTLIREDYIKKLIQLTNDSNLPYFVVESILKEFLETIHAVSLQQLEADRQNYEKQLAQCPQEHELIV